VTVIKDLRVAEAVRWGTVKALFAAQAGKERLVERPGVVKVFLGAGARDGRQIGQRQRANHAVLVRA